MCRHIIARVKMKAFLEFDVKEEEAKEERDERKSFQLQIDFFMEIRTSRKRKKLARKDRKASNNDWFCTCVFVGFWEANILVNSVETGISHLLQQSFYRKNLRNCVVLKETKLFTKFNI
ncbi:CLUMA_CG011609, isoform A [Clunio marinus]|uniref:CLUMA_CG011609, isoform A n=1 Tax=Clunio marinus TaxID=568069 RepID=A0A1J1ID80_9DIPT|nr:CLUMA_CG011609, isoform A [Clunio marinus]